MSRSHFLVVVLLLAGCTGAAAEHELLGDRAFAERRYSDALAEYRLELMQQGSRAGLHAKAGVAALEAMEFEAAVADFIALGTISDSLDRELAADGLQRVARRSLEEGNDVALAAALRGLGQIAPARARGPLAHQLVTSLPAAPTDSASLALLRVAAASVANARVQDSLMYRYARGIRARGDCLQALPVFESLVRRKRDPALGDRAATDATRCALRLGRDALNDGAPSSAEEWFRLAVASGGDGPEVRAAYVGLGDVQFAQGDFISAAEAYLRAMDGLQPGDSIYDVASGRLGAIADAQRGIP